MQHIDVKTILERTVSTTYGDLVTRPTGKAVRGGIEAALQQEDGEQVAVIDFGTVRLLDYSCADEIVGKLLLEHGGVRYFLLQGVTASHCEAIEPVLERHKLAAVARDRDGRIRVLGHVPADAREALSFLTVGSDGWHDPHLPEETAHEVLEFLRRQRANAATDDRTAAE
ncbi:MAG: hypothetical protein IH616_19325 [Gemmatimonadales bacterium]|jgi:hypothetical protein|nr:hypothetical protein [Gemmatimonadales bacterium]